MEVDGVHSVVVNIGGDIAMLGEMSEPVGIVDPTSDAENGTPISEIVLSNRAVATSGDYRRGLDIDGVHYSHIVDPRTGLPAGEIISSTVVAPNPVRTLALWYHEDRFLTEMKAWYRADRLRTMSETTSIVRSIGAATRPAGQYTLTWDGKDNDGALVKAGTYTVYLESSREHGTYQVIRQAMTFEGTPQHVDFPRGSEIASASFDYHKIAN
jgi:ApbE family/Predicted periplasmic protein (DUF2271)